MLSALSDFLVRSNILVTAVLSFVGVILVALIGADAVRYSADTAAAAVRYTADTNERIARLATPDSGMIPLVVQPPTAPNRIHSP